LTKASLSAYNANKHDEWNLSFVNAFQRAAGLVRGGADTKAHIVREWRAETVFPIRPLRIAALKQEACWSFETGTFSVNMGGTAG